MNLHYAVRPAGLRLRGKAGPTGGEMLTFGELSYGGCRLPVADCGLPGESGAFLFCGEPAARRSLPLLPDAHGGGLQA
jgi:hypothetical protein